MAKEILIKKTKNGSMVTVKNGVLYVDGKPSENLREIPVALLQKAKKALPDASAMSGNILFTKDEESAISAAIYETKINLGLSASVKARIKREKANEDIHYIAADLKDEVTFRSATEGQFEIYED